MKYKLVRLFSSMKKPKECYYKVLNLPVNAGPEEIKREYLLLAKKYHPDNNKNVQVEKFKQITEAYEVLSNPIKRDTYDAAILGPNRVAKSVMFQNYEKYKEYSTLTPEQERINNIKNQLKAGVPITNIAKDYKSIKENNMSNRDISDKVWKEIKYDYSIDYRTDSKFSLNKTFKDEYNMHNDKETILEHQYFSSKAEDEYYSKPLKERVKVKMNEMVRIYKHYSFFVLLSSVYVIWMAYIEANKSNILD